MSIRTTIQPLILASFSSLLPAQISIVGAGYNLPAPPSVAPGQITTLSVTGLKTRRNAAQKSTTLPLPTSLAGISVTLQQGTQSYPAPLLMIQQTNLCQDEAATASECFITGITIQVPFEIVADSYPIVPLSATVSEAGVPSKAFSLLPAIDSIHILTACDNIASAPPPADKLCTPIVTHADGSLIPRGMPAVRGETIVIYAVGLGKTKPSVQSGYATPAPAPIPDNSNPSVGFNWAYDASPSIPITPLASGSPPQGPGQPPFAWLTPGFVGLYQLNIAIPPPPVGLLPCHENIYSNLTINIEGFTSFDGAQICVSPPQ